MRFTIITSTFNAARYLAETARSLSAQSHRDFEWIIVDGASTDNTVDVARGFGELVTILISEPDSGIFSAWNKALPFVSGEWVLFLGAGDELYSLSTLSDAANILSEVAPGTTLAYGDMEIIDEVSRKTLFEVGDSWEGLGGPWVIGRPKLPPHPSTFHRATIFSAGFRFDTKCRIAADSEVLLRELINDRGKKLPLKVAKFALSGASSNRRNRLRIIAECVYINWKLGIFFERPFYQAGILLSNLVKYLPRSLGLMKW